MLLQIPSRYPRPFAEAVSIGDGVIDGQRKIILRVWVLRQGLMAFLAGLELFCGENNLEL